MSSALLLGAVAYDAKVVPIWDGIRAYMNEIEPLMDYVLFSNYEAQVDALLRGFIDVAWNTNLAYVRTFLQSEGKCEAVAMRDTDVDFRSVLLAGAGIGVSKPSDVKGKTLAVGSRDSGHAAILPLYFLGQEGLVADRDFKLKRFDLDMGKHGDTGNSEVAVLHAVATGDAEVGAVGDPFWARMVEERHADAAKVVAFWTSPPYHHCNFTILRERRHPLLDAWTSRLLQMDYNNPAHRPLLEMEGLQKWVRATTIGYQTLFEAVEEQRALETVPGA